MAIGPLSLAVMTFVLALVTRSLAKQTGRLAVITAEATARKGVVGRRS